MLDTFPLPLSIILTWHFSTTSICYSCLALFHYLYLLFLLDTFPLPLSIILAWHFSTTSTYYSYLTLFHYFYLLFLFDTFHSLYVLFLFDTFHYLYQLFFLDTFPLPLSIILAWYLSNISLYYSCLTSFQYLYLLLLLDTFPLPLSIILAWHLSNISIYYCYLTPFHSLYLLFLLDPSLIKNNNVYHFFVQLQISLMSRLSPEKVRMLHHYECSVLHCMTVCVARRFTLFLAALLSTVSEHLSTGVFIRTRSDGKLFKLARLKASTNTR